VTRPQTIFFGTQHEQKVRPPHTHHTDTAAATALFAFTQGIYTSRHYVWSRTK